MVCTEVKRTLVKSPPELWSELSDQDSLARHLSEFGEVRITSAEPEQLVEWEAQGASGVVQIKASGWGTKVTLSVTRELPASPVTEQQPSEPEQASETTHEPKAAAELVESPPLPLAESQEEPQLEIEPQPSAPVSTTIAEPQQPSAPEAPAEPTSPAEPRPGLFARLFKRRKVAAVTAPAEATSEPALISDREPVLQPQPEPFQALAAPEPVYPDPPLKPADLPADIVAELAAVEAQIERDTTELLTGVLDRLGAAHHRPFSRA